MEARGCASASPRRVGARRRPGRRRARTPPSSRSSYPETGTLSAPGTVAGRESLDGAHVEQLCAVGRRGELARLGLRADERAAVQLDDPLHVRRPRCARSPADSATNSATSSMRERRVEAPLEADRRRRLRAHRLPAERAGDVARDRPRRRRRARRAGGASGRGPSAPSRASTARSGRAASPTKSESPVRTIHGSSPRVRSLTAKQQCSGRWPGVWMQRRTMSPSAISSPSSQRVVRVLGARPPGGC